MRGWSKNLNRRTHWGIPLDAEVDKCEPSRQHPAPAEATVIRTSTPSRGGHGCVIAATPRDSVLQHRSPALEAHDSSSRCGTARRAGSRLGPLSHMPKHRSRIRPRGSWRLCAPHPPAHSPELLCGFRHCRAGVRRYHQHPLQVLLPAASR